MRDCSQHACCEEICEQFTHEVEKEEPGKVGIAAAAWRAIDNLTNASATASASGAGGAGSTTSEFVPEGSGSNKFS